MATNPENNAPQKRKASQLQQLLRQIIYDPLNYLARLISESWDDLGLFEIIIDLFASIMAVISGLVLGFTQSTEQRELYRLAFFYSLWFLMFLVLGRLFVVTPYKIIRKQDEQLAELHERLRPKFKLSCTKDMIGCHVPNVNGQWRILRVQVVSDCDTAIKNCRGHLLKVEKDGITVFEVDSLVLPFAPSEDEDCTAKTLNPHIPEYLDVLCWHNPGNIVNFALKGGRAALDHKRDYVFKDDGTYILTISVTGDGPPPETTKLKFIWKNPYATAYMEKIL